MTESDAPDGPVGEVTLQTIAMPADTNANGDIFGGWLMAQMDLGASVLARRRLRCEDLEELLEREGRSSMHIAVEVWITRQPSGEHVKVTEANLTFVAISEEGKSRPLP